MVVRRLHTSAMKKLRLVAGIVVGVLFLASLVLSHSKQPPLEVARAYCTNKGIRADDLALLGYRGSNGLFGNNETVEFQLKGSTPQKKLVLTLRQSLYFLNWQVVDFHEDTQHQ